MLLQDSEVAAGGRWLAFDPAGQTAMNELAASGVGAGVVATAGSDVQVDLNTMEGVGFHAKSWQM